jgi:hypothetical protein
MLFQAGLTGYFLYRETVGAQALGRAPEPLPVFILSTLGALAVAALANGLADYLRSRRHAAPQQGTVAETGTVRRRKSRKAAE